MSPFYVRASGIYNGVVICLQLLIAVLGDAMRANNNRAIMNVTYILSHFYALGIKLMHYLWIVDKLS
jgi:hypothetical protein